VRAVGTSWSNSDVGASPDYVVETDRLQSVLTDVLGNCLNAQGSALRLIMHVEAHASDRPGRGALTCVFVAYWRFRRVKHGTHEPAARVLPASAAEPVGRPWGGRLTVEGWWGARARGSAAGQGSA
jgi:hypothetical protein